MKYRLGMLVAALTLAVSVASAQDFAVSTVASSVGKVAMDAFRASDGVVQARQNWLDADQAACNAWSVWANPFGEWAKQSKKGGDSKLFAGYDIDGDPIGGESYAGYRSNTYGIAAGIDRSFGSNLLIGLYTQIADADITQKGGMDAYRDQDVDQLTWAGGLYAVYKWNNLFVEAKTAYLWNRNDYDFDKSNGDGWQGAFDIGYRFVFGCDFVLTPTVGLDYIWLKNDSFRDSYAPGMYNRWDSNTSTSLQLPVMVTLEKSFKTSFGSLTPFVRGGWIHEFHNGRNSVSARNLGEFVDDVGDTVLAYGSDKSYKNAHDLGKVGLGVKADVNGRADMFAAWDYEWAKRYYANTLNVGFGINF